MAKKPVRKVISNVPSALILTTSSTMEKISLSEAPAKLHKGELLLLEEGSQHFLLADARKPEVMSKLRNIKQRPSKKGFTVWVDSDARLNRYVKDVPSLAWDIIDTAGDEVVIVLPGGCNLAPDTLAEDGSVAILFLSNPDKVQIVRSFNGPVAVTEIESSKSGGLPEAILEQVDFLLTLHPQKIGRKGSRVPVIRLNLDNEVKIIREAHNGA
jgi:L-threonylcarbamoyladenylate synthase